MFALYQFDIFFSQLFVSARMLRIEHDNRKYCFINDKNEQKKTMVFIGLYVQHKLEGH